MDAKLQHGYLILADISGYTSYLAGVELDHAHAILTDLLETIVARFKTLLNIVKLEGDAVFAYLPEDNVPRGETLLELLESTYVAFRDRRETSLRGTTCPCRACRDIPRLDLKFLLHHGDYMVQNVSGIKELVGSDVNLVHRLLKNHIGEVTGWRAYTLFTERAKEHLGLQLEGLHVQTEAYEHLGQVNTLSYDLHARYQQLVDARRVVVAEREAHVTYSQDIPASPTVAWDWLNDPHKRARYTFQEGLVFLPILRPGGRTDIGARTHCMHGKEAAMQEIVLDWRPFDYCTVEQDARPMFGLVTMTFRLEPLDEGRRTRLTACLKGQMLPGPLNWLVMKLMWGYLLPTLCKNMIRRIEEDRAREAERPVTEATEAVAA